MESEEIIEGDVCATCKSFSSWSTFINGFCLKNKRSTKKTDTCGYYRPDIKVKYEMECKPNERGLRKPSSLLSD